MDQLVFEHTPKGAHYSRNSSTTRDNVASAVLKLYATPKDKIPRKCVILPSGMAAISALMSVLSTVSYSNSIPSMPSTDSASSANLTSSASSANLTSSASLTSSTSMASSASSLSSASSATNSTPVPASVFVIGSELYCDTLKVAQYQKTHNPFHQVISVDVRKKEAILTAFDRYGPSIKLFFIESCSNPSGQVFDFSLIPELRRKATNCCFAIDNTWTSPISFNPLEVGADIVIESMTKYISGGRCIGGMIIGPHTPFMSMIEKHVKMNGQFIGRDHCEIFLAGIATLKDRMKAVSSLALSVATFLEKHPQISRVLYPCLTSHPTHDMANKFLKLCPGIVLFHVVTKSPVKHAYLNKNKPMLFENKELPFETSYGSSHSKIDQYPNVGLACDYELDKLDDKRHGIWVRLSIGSSSDEEKILKGIQEVIDKLVVL
jgi:cystathionine beta-lyase/cystathionine gamma-synthase